MPGLSNIQPVIPPLKPPRGDDKQPAVVVGHTPSNDPIYSRRILRAAKAKKPKLDGDGNPVVARNPNTGEPLYQRFVAVPEWREQKFILAPDGANNIYIQEWLPPTEAEVQAAELERRKSDVLNRLAERLAREEMGLDVAALEATADALEQAPPPPPAAEPFPRKRGVGGWDLSNGEYFKGKKVDAEAAQAVLDAAAEGF
jgi:hypothetical protein